MIRPRRLIREGRCRRLALLHGAAFGLSLGLLSAAPGSAQIPVIIFGRVQDSDSSSPVSGALIIAGDTATAVYADSLGNFAIELRGPPPYMVHAVHEKYEPTTFELPSTAQSGVSTLLLQRVPAVEESVKREDRVRVASEITSGEFVVARVRSDRLFLRRGSEDAELEVATASLSGLQVRRGREISFLEGLFGGGFAGGLLGGSLGMQCLQTHYDCLVGLSLAQSTLVGAGLGALIGLVVSRRSDEVWEDVRLPHRRFGGPSRLDVPEPSPIIVRSDVDAVAGRAQDATLVPCQQSTCYLTVEWGNRAPGASDRRYGSPLDFEGEVLRHLTAAGYQIVLGSGTDTGSLTIRLEPRMTRARCDQVPGTNTDRSCQTIGEVRVQMLGLPPDSGINLSAQITGRCGADELMDVLRMSEYVAATLDYELRNRQGSRPASRC